MIIVMVQFVCGFAPWAPSPTREKHSGMRGGKGTHGGSRGGRKAVILREILEAAEGRGASWGSLNVAVGVGYISLLV